MCVGLRHRRVGWTRGWWMLFFVLMSSGGWPRINLMESKNQTMGKQDRRSKGDTLRKSCTNHKTKKKMDPEAEGQGDRDCRADPVELQYRFCVLVAGKLI